MDRANGEIDIRSLNQLTILICRNYQRAGAGHGGMKLGSAKMVEHFRVKIMHRPA